MKLKKGILLLSMIFTLALILTGCGQNQPAVSQAPTPQTVTQNEPSTESKALTKEVIKTTTITQQIESSPHGKLGMKCTDCHESKGNEIGKLSKSGWGSCTQCHSAPTLTLGEFIVLPQKQMIEGIGIGDVPNKPSYKWAAMKGKFSCTDCHLTDGTNHDFKVPGVKIKYAADGTTPIGTEIDFTEYARIFEQESCTECHSDTSYTIEKVKQRQEVITKKIETLKLRFAELETKLASLDSKDPKNVQFEIARTYFMYVISDSSKGAHNFALSKNLLERAEVELNKVR
jgi:hypothetical protein